MELWDIISKSAPFLLPVVGAISVIIFTRKYVYDGMVPESILTAQLEREKKLMKEQAEREQHRLKEQAARDEKTRKEQAERDHAVMETAKDLEQNIEELVYQGRSMTEKISVDMTAINERITSLERFMSDYLDDLREHTNTIQQLILQCKKHRDNIPDTQVFKENRTL